MSRMAVRGSKRAAIVRKEAQKKLKQLKKKTRPKWVVPCVELEDLEMSSGRHVVSWGQRGRSAPHAILQECKLLAQEGQFIGSVQAEVWKRSRPASYHLKRLRQPDNPLSKRVAAWEGLNEQPQEFERTPDKEEAWRRVDRTQGEDAFAIYGDDAMFRELPSLAEQMDPRLHVETWYKLSDAKPSPYEPSHASCVVFYMSDSVPSRVGGSVVYDCLGQARVDVNFQHHLVEHGRYQILSGHWHILSVGTHAHQSGMDNHFDYRHCPWIWQAIPKQFNVLPLVPVGL